MGRDSGLLGIVAGVDLATLINPRREILFQCHMVDGQELLMVVNPALTER